MRFTHFLLCVLFAKSKFTLFKIRDTFKKKGFAICLPSFCFAPFYLWRLIFTRLSLSTFLLIVSFIRHILLMYFQPIGRSLMAAVLFAMCLRGACALCPLAHLLISPVNRMDALVRTSLKPIRCTDRDTACPSLSLIENENTELHCTPCMQTLHFHYIAHNSSLPLSLPSVRLYPCPVFTCCHVTCIVIILSPDRMLLTYCIADKIQNSLLGQLGMAHLLWISMAFYYTEFLGVSSSNAR